MFGVFTTFFAIFVTASRARLSGQITQMCRVTVLPATVRRGNGIWVDIDIGKQTSHGRFPGNKLFRKSTNQQWGKQNHVTTKSCSERSRKHLLPQASITLSLKRSAHRGALASRTKRTAVHNQAQSTEQQRTRGRTSVSGLLGSATGSTTVPPPV